MRFGAFRVAVATGAMLVTSTVSANEEVFFNISLEPIGTYASGIYDEGGAEIVAYDSRTRRAFVVNANDTSVDVLDLSQPSNPVRITTAF